MYSLLMYTGVFPSSVLGRGRIMISRQGIATSTRPPSAVDPPRNLFFRQPPDRISRQHDNRPACGRRDNLRSPRPAHPHPPQPRPCTRITSTAPSKAPSRPPSPLHSPTGKIKFATHHHNPPPPRPISILRSPDRKDEIPPLAKRASRGGISRLPPCGPRQEGR